MFHWTNFDTVNDTDSVPENYFLRNGSKNMGMTDAA